MASFKDHTGDEWTITITTGTLRRAKNCDEGRPLLLAFEDGKAWGAMASNPFALGSLLWFLCEEQAVKRGLNPDTFADRFDGPTLQASGMAIMDALTDFSQPSLARTLNAKQAEAIQLATANMNAEIARVPAESLLSALKSREQPESNPGGIPSAS